MTNELIQFKGWERGPWRHFYVKSVCRRDDTRNFTRLYVNFFLSSWLRKRYVQIIPIIYLDLRNKKRFLGIKVIMVKYQKSVPVTHTLHSIINEVYERTIRSWLFCCYFSTIIKMFIQLQYLYLSIPTLQSSK